MAIGVIGADGLRPLLVPALVGSVVLLGLLLSAASHWFDRVRFGAYRHRPRR